jgi:hypothetical protein
MTGLFSIEVNLPFRIDWLSVRISVTPDYGIVYRWVQIGVTDMLCYFFCLYQRPTTSPPQASLFCPTHNIVYDIVCNIVYDVVYDIVCDIIYDVNIVHVWVPFVFQDTLCLVAPYPFRLEPLEDFDPLVDFDMTGGDDVWFARPQLLFTCSLCPTRRSQDKSSHREDIVCTPTIS